MMFATYQAQSSPFSRSRPPRSTGVRHYGVAVADAESHTTKLANDRYLMWGDGPPSAGGADSSLTGIGPFSDGGARCYGQQQRAEGERTIVKVEQGNPTTVMRMFRRAYVS